jgi:hypothetical protein
VPLGHVHAGRGDVDDDVARLEGGFGDVFDVEDGGVAVLPADDCSHFGVS